MEQNNYIKSKYPVNVPKLKSTKFKKPYKGAAHTPASSKGLGDYYGTGIVAKIGKMRSGIGYEEISPAKMKKAPRSLV
jgi:hypothetical protein